MHINYSQKEVLREKKSLFKEQNPPKHIQFLNFQIWAFKNRDKLHITGFEISLLHDASIIWNLAYKWLNREEKEDRVGHLSTRSFIGCLML